MDRNREAYESGSVVRWYDQLSGLSTAEKAIFDEHRSLLNNGNVLDIGIGAGRTTQFLLEQCGEYTGIDYSGEFIQLVKKKFPQSAILQMDARDLSNFKDKTFDFINFSFNGIDYADGEGRLKILDEISRVLKPGGLFFFCTHNKDHTSFNKWPWDGPIPMITKLKTFIKILPFIFKKRLNNRLEVFTDYYAIINDFAHNYSLLTFYSTPALVRAQLTTAGFSNVTMYNKNGVRVKDDLLDDWIYVTAEKPPSSFYVNR